MLHIFFINIMFLAALLRSVARFLSASHSAVVSGSNFHVADHANDTVSHKYFFSCIESQVMEVLCLIIDWQESRLSIVFALFE